MEQMEQSSHYCSGTSHRTHPLPSTFSRYIHTPTKPHPVTQAAHHALYKVLSALCSPIVFTDGLDWPSK